MLPLKYVNIGHETLAYREEGRGDTVLLIHGNMSSSAHFDVLIDELAKTHHVLAVDMRGFGGSTYHNRFDDLVELMDDVKEMLNQLSIKRLTCLGWSTGGGVAMLLAAKYPDLVKRLVLLESVGVYGYPVYVKDDNYQPVVGSFYPNKEALAQDPIQVKPVLTAIENKDRDFYRNLWNQLIYTAGNQPEPEQYERYIDDMLTQRNLVDIDYALTRFNISEVSNGLTDGTGEAKLIKAKVDVIQGENDLVVPYAMCETITQHITHATLHLLDQSGHNPLIDQFDKVVEIIRGE